jgi:phosphate transport system substrate-binding protein
LVLGLALTAVTAACGGTSGGGGGGGQTSATITGAGATFPEPLYTKWASEYQNIAGTRMNYSGVGSGAGIQAIQAKTVDFGATDAPLSEADLNAAGLAQFPMTMGGVVIVVSLDGVTDRQLKLDGPTLAKIFMGDIAKWSDPAIAALNGGVTLPDTQINVVHRSDGSGTTWIFSKYLSAVSPEWKTKLGADKEIAWPVGVGGKGNPGVAAAVQQVKGSIGYVEYAFAKQNTMTTTQLKNKDGQFIAPTLDAFAAAAATADFATVPGFGLAIVDQAGPSSWPITGASFILIYKGQPDAERAKEMLKFFDWAYTNGKDIATGLDYVPIPDSVVKLVEDMWAKDITVSGTPVWP